MYTIAVNTCGVAGCASLNNNSVENINAQILTMIETISHHGSDDISGWSNSSNNIGFAHALLAIIDITSPGIQPMKGQANQTIVYNGEIYNYREIRDTESERGRKFNLKSYTECVLAA